MKQEFYDLAQYALDTLKTKGADGAEVFISRGQTDELNVDAGTFSLMRTTFNSSFSLRALVGGRKGTAGGNRLDRESVNKVIDAAVDAAKSSRPDEAEYIAEDIGEHSFEDGAKECELDKLYDRVKEFMDDTKVSYPKIDLFQLISKFTASNSIYANSNGSRVLYKTGLYSCGGSLCARDGEKVSSFNGFGARTEELNIPIIERMGVRRVLSETERQIDTVPVSGKFVGKLLVATDCLPEFLYSVLSNCVSDGVMITGISPWKDKLGEIVADKRLNVSYSPLDPRMICPSRITSDGHLVENQDIIKVGKLAGFALSQYGAKKTGLKRAGNTSGNLVVGAGDSSYADLLSGIDNGILINRFSGGQPATNGDFSGIAKNSFLIRNGKITDAVSETMVSGNLLDMLNNIAGISRETECDGSAVLPWIVFDGVTISGK